MEGWRPCRALEDVLGSSWDCLQGGVLRVLPTVLGPPHFFVNQGRVFFCFFFFAGVGGSVWWNQTEQQ